MWTSTIEVCEHSHNKNFQSAVFRGKKRIPQYFYHGTNQTTNWLLHHIRTSKVLFSACLSEIIKDTASLSHMGKLQPGHKLGRKISGDLSRIQWRKKIEGKQNNKLNSEPLNLMEKFPLSLAKYWYYWEGHSVIVIVLHGQWAALISVSKSFPEFLIVPGLTVWAKWGVPSCVQKTVNNLESPSWKRCCSRRSDSILKVLTGTRNREQGTISHTHNKRKWAQIKSTSSRFKKRVLHEI